MWTMQHVNICTCITSNYTLMFLRKLNQAPHASHTKTMSLLLKDNKEGLLTHILPSITV